MASRWKVAGSPADRVAEKMHWALILVIIISGPCDSLRDAWLGDATMNLLLVMPALLLITAGDPPRSDLDRLQGTWLLVAMEREGEDVPAEDFKDWKAVYEENRITLRAGERVRRRGIVTLDPSRKPKAINTWDQDGPYEDQTVPGIYDLDGDTLKVCFARPGAERPKEFTTKAGPGFVFCVYKRQTR
jgi:uncharacterized protein (TIGR03067 family)